MRACPAKTPNSSTTHHPRVSAKWNHGSNSIEALAPAEGPVYRTISHRVATVGRFVSPSTATERRLPPPLDIPNIVELNEVQVSSNGEAGCRFSASRVVSQGTSTREISALFSAAFRSEPTNRQSSNRCAHS